MNGEIVAIRQILNEDLSVNCYEVIIDFKNIPNLKLGNCKIEQ